MSLLYLCFSLLLLLYRSQLSILVQGMMSPTYARWSVELCNAHLQCMVGCGKAHETKSPNRDEHVGWREHLIHIFNFVSSCFTASRSSAFFPFFHSNISEHSSKKKKFLDHSANKIFLSSSMHLLEHSCRTTPQEVPGFSIMQTVLFKETILKITSLVCSQGHAVFLS